MSRFRLGIQMFIRDMHESVPLSVTFAIAVVAFLVALAAITGLEIR